MSASVAVAAEWEQLGARYYRKTLLYPLPFSSTPSRSSSSVGSGGGSISGFAGAVDLSTHRVAAATFGGPVAAVRDESKIVQLLAEPARRRLLLFSASGRPLASAPWAPPAPLAGLHFSDDLVLAALLADARLLLFSLSLTPLSPPLSIVNDSNGSFTASVVFHAFWGNGVAVLTDDGKIHSVTDFRKPSIAVLADAGIEDVNSVLCMVVIEPRFTMSGTAEVVVALADGSVLCVDEEAVVRLGEGLELGPLQSMVVAPNGRLVAAFAHDGKLLVITTDFTRVIFDYECQSTLPPIQIAWCGLDTVLLYWDEVVLMVGPDGDPVSYYYDEPIKLITECDGVRILSNSSMEFLHRVPDSTVSIYGIGSTEPAALLYDALDHFDKLSAKADENLRLVRSSLPEAIKSCIDAAGHEFDISRQRTLLRAAGYGRAFCSHFSRDQFQEMCKMLRVLNAVRDPEVGIPLSIQQYKVLTSKVLIARLISGNQHLLALRISKYLSLNPNDVIVHWACEKITASPGIQDHALLHDLVGKLSLGKGISHAAIAAHADKNGRRKLAAMLVSHDHPSKQVPLLLSIEEEDIALGKAVDSGDPDLVYLVIFHMWQKFLSQDLQPSEFFGTINARPLARDLFIAYSRIYKHEFLKDYFLISGQLQDVVFLLLKEANESENNLAGSRATLYAIKEGILKQAQKFLADHAKSPFESQAVAEYSKLLSIQHKLETDTKQLIYLNSNVSDTIRTLLELGNHQGALKIKTTFQVPDKSWYWIKAFALAHKGNWEALEKFSKEKKPPGGYKPFVEACIANDEKTEAQKYIPKLQDARERAEAYSRLGMEKEANDAAAQAQDSDMFGRSELFRSELFTRSASSIWGTLRSLTFQQGGYSS